MTNKEKYIKICKDVNYSQQIPIFSTPHWLDAVSKNWDVCICEEKGKITGVLPYCLKGAFVTKRIYIPELTAYSGPVLFCSDQTDEYEKRSFEKKIITGLLEQLPKNVIKTSIKCYPEIDNWLPFYWKDYYQTSRYTYILNDLKNPSIIFENFKDSHQRQIRKAEKANLIIQQCNDVSTAFDMFKNTFEKQELKTPFSKDHIGRIFDTVKEHKCGEILIAKNKSGKPLASIFVVWDNLYTYYLLGGYDESDSKSGAMTYLFRHVLLEAKKHSKAFRRSRTLFSRFRRQINPYSFYQ